MTNSERESAIAMDLARRTYLYRLMHIVFGSRPTSDSISKVLNEETLAMFGQMEEVLARGDFDGIAGRPAGSSGSNLAACAEVALTCIESSKGKIDDPLLAEGFVEGLRVDYDKLFQVPGDNCILLWESPYTGKQSMVFQESTLDVRSFYHDAGFKLLAEKRFPDDHIAAMMDYMGCLSQRAYETYADGFDDEVLRTLATQRRFSDQHILTWIDLFASKVIESDAHAYYGALAGGMAAFVHMDRLMVEQLEEELAEK